MITDFELEQLEEKYEYEIWKLGIYSTEDLRDACANTMKVCLEQQKQINELQERLHRLEEKGV